MANAQSRLKLSEDATFQSMGPGEQTVVLSLSSGYLYTCNETTAAFLEALDGRRTVGEIVENLTKRYDVTPQRLESDLVELANRLMGEKLIVELPDTD